MLGEVEGRPSPWRSVLHTGNQSERVAFVLRRPQLSGSGVPGSGGSDGGLGHGQLLSQVIEACDVVHAALAHHTSKLRVHFCHVGEAAGLKRVVGVAVQEARTKQSRAAGGARGGQGGSSALIRRDHAGEQASQCGVS